MGNFVDTFLSPLGKEWCMYYFLLLIFAFVGLLITIITSLMSLFTAKKFTFLGFWNKSLFPVMVSLVAYFLSRLVYSICVGALN